MNNSAAATWVSIEGINGVGKSYLATRAADQLGNRCLPLVELPDSQPDNLTGQVIQALRGAGDPFLRTGCPRTETLLLAALQVHRYERANPTAGQVVLEDRGPHSVAVYQAAVLAEATNATEAQAFNWAREILRLQAKWRPLPQVTALIVDDADLSLSRFEQRIGRTSTPGERTLMRRADRLYRMFAGSRPRPFRTIDRRRLDEHAAVEMILDACTPAGAADRGASACQG